MIDKIKTIAKSMIEPLPVGQVWYEDRVKICNSCEYNTKNIKREDLSAVDKVKLTVHLCPEGDHCTACGCCTHRKASQKTEVCGLAEIGKEPKWPALAIKMPIDSKIFTENLTPAMGELKIVDKTVLYDLGESANERYDFSIALKRNGPFKIKSLSVGCSCTVADPTEIGENSYKLDVTLTVKNLKPGNTALKSLKVHYYGDSSKSEEMLVQIKLKKKQ